MRTRLGSTLLAALLAVGSACEWDNGVRGGDAGARTDAGLQPDASLLDAASSTDGAPPVDARPVDAAPPDADVSQVEAVCNRWNSDRTNLNEGSWSGSVPSCTPGDVTAVGRDNALKLVNLYRWLASLPSVTHDSTRNQKAQACALMMDANNALSHDPPTSWGCYTADGSQAAGSSNIATTPGVAAVDLYMIDPGNATTIGHRRWILSNSLGAIGLGTTDSYSCMWVIGTGGSANAQWTAWPPPGPVPIGVFNASWTSLDDTGWTVQSNSVNLSGAQVTVTSGGQNRPVTVTQLLGGYGSTHAIRFNPSGWSTQAGTTYAVSVTGVSPTIQYDVQVVSCN